MEIALGAGFSRRLHVGFRGLPGLFVCARRLIPISQASEDMGRHVQGMRDGGSRFRVLARCFKPLLGVCRIVIEMDQIMQDTRMVWTMDVDLFEELGCLRLALKTLRTFLDCPENAKTVEKLGLI